MWFKNATIYSLDPLWCEEARGIDKVACLRDRPLLPVNQASMRSMGWVEVTEGSYGLPVAEGMIIALGTETRMLPSSVIKDHVEARITAFAQANGHKPGRKAVREIKDLVIDELRPKAFVKKARLHGLVDLRRRLIVIDTASASAAEEFLIALRVAWGSLQAAPLDTANKPSSAMSQWLLDVAPDPFVVGDACLLEAKNTVKSAVRYARQDLGKPGVKQEIRDGAVPTQLSLNWRDAIDFALTDSLQLRRIRMTDVGREASRDNTVQDAEADARIFADSITHLITDVITALGGIKQ